MTDGLQAPTGALLLLTLWFAVVPMPGRAATADTPANGATTGVSDHEVAAFFDGFIREQMERLGIPGGALIVVRHGEMILARGYGHADVQAKRPVDVDVTVFRAASISKLLPWLTAMQLVEDGALDLDADINHYLDFKVPEAFGQPITMRHLMTHTAGFPERFHGVFDQDLSQSLGERLRRNLPERTHAPGTVISYANYGAALAGYIVERLRGEPWSDVASTRVLGPLGMRRSTVLQPVPDELLPQLAGTYSFGSDIPGEFRVTPLAPMGSLSATAADMGRLLSMLANRGRTAAGGTIVRADTLESMLRLQVPLLPGLPDGMGLGFLVGRYHGVRYAGHAGNMTTLATDLELLPDHDLAWYYVFNSQGAGEGARQVRGRLLRAAIDRFAAAPAAPLQARPPSSAADVAGAYVSSRRLYAGPLMSSGLLDTTVVAARADGSLVIESAGQMTEWLADGSDRFVEKVTAVPLTVTRDDSGRVIRLASGAIYPAAVFERAPRLVTIVPIVAVFSLGTLLLGLFGKAVAATFSRWRPRRPLDTDVGQTRAMPSSQRWAARSYWLLIASLAGWAAFAVGLAIDFSVLFRTPSVVRLTLGLLTMLSAPAALAIVWDAMRNDRRPWPSRIWALILGSAAAGLAWLYYTLDFVDVSTNW